MKLKLNEETQGGKDGISLGPELRNYPILFTTLIPGGVKHWGQL
jgi:hypothetical protein